MNIESIISNHLSNDMPRSEAYRLGMVAGFRAMHERVSMGCPYKCGTEGCDAFFGGRKDGMELYEEVKSKVRY